MPSPFVAVTVDCYGTLIDWQRGLAKAWMPLNACMEFPYAEQNLFELFAMHEREVQAGPYRPYREVLAEVARLLAMPSETAAQWVKPEDLATFAASVPDWPAFAETPGALKRIKAVVGTLAIVSNVDDDLFAGTRVHLEAGGAPIDHVITAQQVRTYKPARAHFERALSVLQCEPRRVLHVAESRYHDIEPAGAMGFTTVWIDRAKGKASASGPGGGTPDYTFSTLGALAEALERGEVTPRGTGDTRRSVN